MVHGSWLMIQGGRRAPLSYFSVSGALLEGILAPRDRPGGPWEQQDGREVANNRISGDFLGFKMLKN